MHWSFALINNRLAEIHFEKKGNKIAVFGHCYVKESDYTTKTEQKYIKKDTAKFRLTYRNGQYRSKTRDDLVFTHELFIPQSLWDTAGILKDGVEDLDSYLKEIRGSRIN